MSAEATAINMAARASLWLKPHRIVLILIALALVLCAAFFMRWEHHGILAHRQSSRKPTRAHIQLESVRRSP